jgi:P-type Ca2+ transporter type 2C
VADQVASGLSAQAGIHSVDVRVVTGSVIVSYADDLTQDAILEVLKSELEAALAGRSPGRAGPSQSAGRSTAQGRSWHASPASDVVAELGTDTDQGLGAAQVEERRRRFGANVMPHEAPPSRITAMVKQFQSMPVAMLGASSVVSLATGRPIEAVATLAVVAANAVLGYVTEGQAESSIAALMGSSDQAVSVLREGTEQRVRSADLVPGDVLVVRAGSQVLADARLVEAERLRVDQSALTGETVPVAKDPSADPDPDAPIGERPTMLHSGTLITQGQGRAIVVATGPATEAARIAIASQTGARPRAPIENGARES